jgi:hypothetical protein
MNKKTKELLERKFDPGVTVINCVVHISLDLRDRPDDCPLCLADLRNHLATATRINEWLNRWKDDATKILESK